MEPYVDMLKVGGKSNSLGRVNEVITDVLVNKSRLEELYDCLFFDDAWVRMRAADALEKICRQKPEWIEPYVDKLLKDVTVSGQPSLQWHLAQISTHVRLSKGQTEQFVSWLKSLLKSTKVDWIVSVNTMKALLYFYDQKDVSKDELLPLFTLQEGHITSKTVRKKAGQFLEDIA